VYEIIEQLESTQPISVAQMCEVVGVSRCGYYRWHCGVVVDDNGDDDLELRDEMQRIALEMSTYGYRRITAELKRRGFVANHKRVRRLMGEDNLLCLHKKSFIKTTDSNHNEKVYPNLAGDLVLTRIDQLWVADITYIRLLKEFIYLAVVLDAFSRRCIGWALSRTLETEVALEALNIALGCREVVPGLVHHSDRGVQYASEQYTGLLKENKILISMSRTGNPYDNAKAESFIKTLKMEEVYLYEYENIDEAYSRIGEFIEEVYNQKRLHSSLGYVPPAEFEQSLFRLKIA
jgi:putative transposase